MVTIECNRKMMAPPQSERLIIDGVVALTRSDFKPLDLFGPSGPPQFIDLFIEDCRPDIEKQWQINNWPLDMIDDAMAEALDRVMGQRFNRCEAVAAVALDSPLAPRVQARLVAVDFWNTPLRMFPAVLYGIVCEFLGDDKGVAKLDRLIIETDREAVTTSNPNFRAELEAWNEVWDDLMGYALGYDHEEDLIEDGANIEGGNSDE